MVEISIFETQWRRLQLDRCISWLFMLLYPIDEKENRIRSLFWERLRLCSASVPPVNCRIKKSKKGAIYWGRWMQKSRINFCRNKDHLLFHRIWKNKILMKQSSGQPNRRKIRYYSVFGSVRLGSVQFFQENRTEYL